MLVLLAALLAANSMDLNFKGDEKEEGSGSDSDSDSDSGSGSSSGSSSGSDSGSDRCTITLYLLFVTSKPFINTPQ
jgi:hypothetical protein